MERTVAVSGGFDPLHVGHLELFKNAKKHGDRLLVIVNTDKFLKEKKGYVFMPLAGRMRIINNLKAVDMVAPSIDKDMTVTRSLAVYNPDIFANGGDRNNSEIPEFETCKEHGVKLVDDLGEKVQSSSDLVDNAVYNKFTSLINSLRSNKCPSPSADCIYGASDCQECWIEYLKSIL